MSFLERVMTQLTRGVWGRLVRSEQYNSAILLTAPLNLYVRTDGNDRNNGRTNTARGAFLTLQRAMVEAGNYNTSFYAVTVNVGDGTYTGDVNPPGMMFGPNMDIRLIGNVTTPANVIVTGFLTFQSGKFYVKGISGFQWIAAFFGCSVEVDSCLMNVSNGFTGALFANNAGYIYAHDSTFSFSGVCAMAAGANGSVEMYAITVSGTPTYTDGFAKAQFGGNVSFDDQPSGAAIGPRYRADTNGIIMTYGGGATYLPGDAAGTAETGGQYV